MKIKIIKVEDCFFYNGVICNEKRNEKRKEKGYQTSCFADIVKTIPGYKLGHYVISYQYMQKYPKIMTMIEAKRANQNYET